MKRQQALITLHNEGYRKDSGSGEGTISHHSSRRSEHRRLGIQRDVPLAVQQWGGLIAVNYAARDRGIKRFTSLPDALKLCPELKLVHVETIDLSGSSESFSEKDGKDSWKRNRLHCKASLDRYRKASFEVLEVVNKFASKIEKASIDEFYIDLTEKVEEKMRGTYTDDELDYSLSKSYFWGNNPIDLRSEEGMRLAIAAKYIAELRQAVFEETEFTLSVGIAHNKLISKQASAANKPNKQTVVPQSSIADLLKQIPLKDLRGFGGKLGTIVEKLVVESLSHEEKISRQNEEIGGEKSFRLFASDVQRISPQRLRVAVGDRASYVYNLCRGQDDEPVCPNLKPKSLLAFKSFAATESMKEVDKWLSILSLELANRITEDCERFRRRPCNMVLYCRSIRPQNNLSETRSRQCSMPTKYSDYTSLYETARRIFKTIEKPFPCNRVAVGAVEFKDLLKDSNTLIHFFQKQENTPRNHQCDSQKKHAPDNATEDCSKDKNIRSSNDGSEVLVAENQRGSFFCKRCNTIIEGSLIEHQDFHFAMSIQLEEDEFHRERSTVSPSTTEKSANQPGSFGKKLRRSHKPKTVNMSKSSKLEQFFGR